MGFSLVLYANAALQAAERFQRKKVAIVVSGGNATLDHLRRVLLDADV